MIFCWKKRTPFAGDEETKLRWVYLTAYGYFGSPTLKLHASEFSEKNSVVQPLHVTEENMVEALWYSTVSSQLKADPSRP